MTIREIERICHDGELVDNKALISETFNQHFVSSGEKPAEEISAPVNHTLSYLSRNKVNDTNYKFERFNPVKCINCKVVQKMLRQVEQIYQKGYWNNPRVC